MYAREMSPSAESRDARPAARAVALRGAVGLAGLAAMQQTAGNTAVAQMLQRAGSAGSAGSAGGSQVQPRPTSTRGVPDPARDAYHDIDLVALSGRRGDAAGTVHRQPTPAVDASAGRSGPGIVLSVQRGRGPNRKKQMSGGKRGKAPVGKRKGGAVNARVAAKIKAKADAAVKETVLMKRRNARVAAKVKAGAAVKKAAVKELGAQLVKELTGQKQKWTQYGAGQSLTVHLPGAERGKGASVAEQLYANSANVHEPKPFDGDRLRAIQGMRWMSTVAKIYLDLKTPEKKAEEVQATIVADVLYISANRNVHNDLLRELAATCANGLAFAKALLDGIAEERKNLEGRSDRHAVKLEARIAKPPAAGGAPADDYANLRTVQVDVPDNVPRASDGLHAERRLSELPGFDAKMTAGIKRPCVACYKAVYAEAVEAEAVKKGGEAFVHPGPGWVSQAANMDISDYLQIATMANYATKLHKAIRDAHGTHVTRGQDGKLTWNNDTDSDTDTEGEPYPKDGAKGDGTMVSDDATASDTESDDAQDGDAESDESGDMSDV